MTRYRWLPEQVAENRNQTRRLDSQFISVSNEAERNVTLSSNFIEVGVEVSVYTRTLGKSLISGHPDQEYGSGRGVSGDNRNRWIKQSVNVLNETLVRGGRNALRDALNGDDGPIYEIAIGSGNVPASVSDDALFTEKVRVYAGSRKVESNVTRAISRSLSFNTIESTDAEIGVYDESGRMLSRSVLSDSLSNSPDLETKIEVDFTVEGRSVGDAMFTEAGKESLADSLVYGGQIVGLETVAVGDSDNDPSETDEQLSSLIAERRCVRVVGPESITTRIRLEEREPIDQPVQIREIGVFDNLGRMIWRTTLQPVLKNSMFDLVITVGFNVQSK